MSGETLFRQWLMIHLIPRDPQRKSTTDIHRALVDREFKVTVRTVQRDLAKLSDVFHYSSDEDGRTQRWFFPKGQRLLEVPAMDSGAALTFSLAQRHLAPILPPATLSLIAPYFARAEEVLKDVTSGSLASWKERVCVMSRGPKLGAPKIVEAVQHAVYDAVLQGRQLKVMYRARGADKVSEMDLHAIGLVLHDGVPYLVATAWTYTDLRAYALHRISEAVLLEQAAVRPKGFKLAEYVEREFRYPVSPETIKFVGRFGAAAAKHLLERPLAADQAVKEDGTTVEISATVQDTEELRWWILGMGSNVEVLHPAKLRQDIKQRVLDMAQKYDA